jgi:hypothetical protein
MPASYRFVKIGHLTVDIGLFQKEAEIIKGKTPVRTGTLRDGFQAQGDGTILNLIPYGIFVELGTGAYYKGELGPPLRPGWPRGFPGRYMVERSLDEMADSILDRVLKDRELRNLLELPDEIVINVSGKGYKEHGSSIPHEYSASSASL